MFAINYLSQSKIYNIYKYENNPGIKRIMHSKV